MKELSSEQLKWRLINQHDPGHDLVTFVLPVPAEEDEEEYLLETGVVTQHMNHEEDEVYWSSNDIGLLLSLTGIQPDEESPIELNFSDPSVVQMIHIVAAARFSPGYQFHPEDQGKAINTVMGRRRLGDLVAIHSDSGYHLGVLVNLDKDQGACVVLEPFYGRTTGQYYGLHDVVWVNRAAMLPTDFANSVHRGDKVTH